MRITILQSDIEWAQPEVNASRMKKLIESNPGSHLYVLPEMWSTGFATNPQAIAETDGKSLAWMKRTAARVNAALCGSVAVRDEEGLFRNRFYFVRPDGSTDFYDKRHLFAFGGEDTHYTRGEQRTVAQYGGFRFLLLTCYDLRFPVWSRYQGDYDAIIYVASWPDTRQEVWSLLLKARAIENQCFVVGANRVGNDPVCRYTGGSAIIDAKGHTLAESTEAKEETLTADLSIEEQNTFRSKFRVLDDRD